MLERSSRAEVVIELGPGGADELDRSTEQLARRLRELDVQDVRRHAVAIDGEPVVERPGLLVVDLAPVVPALHDVVHTVRAWLSHNPEQVASLTIDGDRLDVTGGAAEEQRELVRSWTDRHSATEL